MLTSRIKRYAAVLAAVVAAALTVGSAAFADPARSPMNFPLHAVCTGLGPVALNQMGPSQTDAFHVDGTNTIVIGGANGAPGLLQQALAAGTTCTFAFGTFPVLIVNG